MVILWGKNTEFYPLICFMNRLFIPQKIIELSSIDSTNSYLINLSQNIELDEGTIVIAYEQTKGKGQRKNSWSSEPSKSLCISLLLRPRINVSKQFLFNKFISLSLCQALAEYNIPTVIKWPNDILIETKKIAGILIENSIRSNEIEKSIVGIGVNISNNISHLPYATTLKNHLKITPSLNELIKIICVRIEVNYELLKKNPSLVNKLYHNNLFKIGELQKFSVNGEFFDGIINSVNEKGQLVVEVNNDLNYYVMGQIKFII